MENKKVNLKIYRFNPEKNEKPYYETYVVPLYKGMTLLDALFYIKENIDSSLSFRAYCRAAICGSCSILVNGHPKLACKTQVKIMLELFETDTLKLDPLPSYKVIRDLVVDYDKAITKLVKVKPYLIPDPNVVPLGEDRETIIYPEEHKKYDPYTDCILCGACFAMCPVKDLDENYAGPLQFARLARFTEDKRDALKEERPKLAFTLDVWNCLRCERCTDVCPKSVPITQGIATLKAKTINQFENYIGVKHAKAICEDVKKHGYLNENTLILRTKGVKGVIESLPLAIKLLTKGKVMSFFPHKIENLKEIKDLIK